jgi:aspartate carbamoyltransferase catalytic subunit
MPSRKLGGHFLLPFNVSTERLKRRIYMLNGRNLIDPMDFTLEELDEVFELADRIIENPKKYSKVCEGKLLATLFYEPSTRTRLSFEAAMLRLGGQVLGFSDASSSSVSKGESLGDTIKTVGCYADIIAMRHPKEGAAKVATMYSDIPVINAGDGGHQHPTQTLTDLLTIKSIKGQFSNHIIGICGDLKFGRTVHSLVKALSRYENNKFILISPKELKIPDYIKEEILEKNSIEYVEVERLDEVIDELDILYMTRVQKERFFNEEEYIRLKDSYILNQEKMKSAKEDMIVLHPLPRVNEIAQEIDSDSRACYFKQARFGMFVRMALISKLLGVCD